MRNNLNAKVAIIFDSANKKSKYLQKITTSVVTKVVTEVAND